MLLTGVDNHLNGVGNMRETIPQSHVGRAGYLSVLNQRVVTVSSLLQDSGYRTYVAGKWHVGKEPHNLPPARGFDRSLVMGDSGSDNWETGKLYLDLTDKVYWYDNGQEAKMPKEFYSTEFYINKTLEYLQADAKSDKPFFAYIAFQANHIPLQAPQSFIDKYKGRYDKGYDYFRTERLARQKRLGLVAQGVVGFPRLPSVPAWDTLTDYERLPHEPLHQDVLGVPVRKAVIQVVAGRNIAVLVEAAVRNTILQLRGIDTYQEFVARHRAAMSRGE